MADICAKNIIDYIADLGPVIAAFIACGLAWWQGKIQKKQHNLNLFKERWEIKTQLEACVPEVLNISGENNTYMMVYQKLSKIIDICSYLFNEEIAQKTKKIADLYLKTSALSRKNTHLAKTNHKVDDKATDEEYDNILKLHSDLQNLMEMISSYLKKNNF